MDEDERELLNLIRSSDRPDALETALQIVLTFLTPSGSLQDTASSGPPGSPETTQ